MQIVSAMDREGLSSSALLNAIDTDGSGDVDLAEFRLGFQNILGICLSDDNLDVLFKEFDSDGSGTIDSAQFISKLAMIRGEPDMQTAVQTIVDWMDRTSHTVQSLMSLFDEDGMFVHLQVSATIKKYLCQTVLNSATIKNNLSIQLQGIPPIGHAKSTVAILASWPWCARIVGR